MQFDTLTIHVITDDTFLQFHGIDLGLNELKQISIRIRILYYSTVDDIRIAIANKLNWNLKDIQLWRISNRKNGTTRPNRFLYKFYDQRNSYCLSKKEHERNENQKFSFYLILLH